MVDMGGWQGRGPSNSYPRAKEWAFSGSAVCQQAGDGKKLDDLPLVFQPGLKRLYLFAYAYLRMHRCRKGFRDSSLLLISY